MKYVFLLLIPAMLACSNKRYLQRKERIQNDIWLQNKVRAELTNQLHLLENLNIQLRKVEKKDSAGNSTITTDLTVNRQQTTDQTTIGQQTTQTDLTDRTQTEVQQKEKKSRPGMIWKFITTGIIILIGAGLYFYLRERKRTR